MNGHFQSDSISLLLINDAYTSTDELWKTFRRTAVEPGQSSSPDFASFADDCLLCAHIVTNGTTKDENLHRDELLWEPEEHAQDPSPSSSMTSNIPPSSAGQTVGLVYLHAGPANLPGGEANIGVVTKPDMQRRGYAREAVQLVLRWAFEELKFHRIQAAVLDTPFKDRALRLFIGSGFAHEGTKRRAVYQPEGEGMAGVWKDVTYLAMLDTEWVLKSTMMRTNRTLQSPLASVWDEMFARHAREREELVRWEETHGRVRRTLSTETLREHARNAAQNIAYLTDDASSISASSPPSPRPNLIVTWEGDVPMADDLHHDELRQRWEEVVETSLAARRHRRWLGTASLDPSLQDRMLALPSIPSTRLSEGNLQSPLTIPSPGSTPPPFSPSPSPTPSSAHSTWSDTEDEREWVPREDPFATPRDAYAYHHPVPASPGTRSRSSSASSSRTDDWSDAQSSVGASSGSWDVVSNASDRSRHEHF